VRTIRKKHHEILYIQPQVCNIESAIQLTPVAIIVIVGICVDIFGFFKRISAELQQGLIVYVAGIIFFDRKQSASVIANKLGGVSHDHLTRLMARFQWRSSSVIVRFVSLIQRLGIKGHLLLDDTAIKHPRSKKVEGVYWDHDSAEKRNVLCQRLVLLLWSDGFLRIPVGYALWHKKGARKKYRTKNELARTLVKWAVHRGLKPTYIAFDSWYASRENLKLFAKDLKIPFVTKLKNNCKLTYKGRKMTAKAIGKELLEEKRPYRSQKTGLWARKATVSYGCGLGNMCFVVIKDELDGEKPGIRHLLASTPELSAVTVVQRYRSRWIIETFFQDLKQHLGMSSYQGRKLEGAYRHFALCFVALVVLDFLRKGKGYSLREAKSEISSTFFIRDEVGCYHQAILQPSTPSSLKDLGGVISIVKNQIHNSLASGYGHF
jgi:hypothetical protein